MPALLRRRPLRLLQKKNKKKQHHEDKKKSIEEAVKIVKNKANKSVAAKEKSVISADFQPSKDSKQLKFLTVETNEALRLGGVQSQTLKYRIRTIDYRDCNAHLRWRTKPRI